MNTNSNLVKINNELVKYWNEKFHCIVIDIIIIDIV